jgi:carboxymethylenebutenolidase
MERKKASDFPQELLDAFDHYVHGRRRVFLDEAHKFATAGVTVPELFEMLSPNYAWAIQVPPDDKRLATERDTLASPQGNGSIRGYLARPGSAKLPVVLVVHENHGPNRYVEDTWRGDWRSRAMSRSRRTG